MEHVGRSRRKNGNFHAPIFLGWKRLGTAVAIVLGKPRQGARLLVALRMERKEQVAGLVQVVSRTFALVQHRRVEQGSGFQAF